LLIMTMHGLSACEAGIGQATHAQHHASARQYARSPRTGRARASLAPSTQYPSCIPITASSTTSLSSSC
jgi:hypothetical protein